MTIRDDISTLIGFYNTIDVDLETFMAMDNPLPYINDMFELVNLPISVDESFHEDAVAMDSYNSV